MRNRRTIRSGPRTVAGRRRPRERAAFTLTELLLAVVVLIVVIIATSKMFGTASKVASLAEVNSQVNQESATIERQVREDFKRLSDDGFMLIRCVRVRNDVNLGAGGPLLDPSRAPGEFLRADQLFFFAEGAQQMMTLGTVGTNIRGLGTASRIYYGHTVQLPFKEAGGTPGDILYAHDFKMDYASPLLPWHRGPYDTVRTIYTRDQGSPPDYDMTNAGQENATQPPAPSWLLARHAVVLADDGDDRPEHYLLGNRTALSIDHHPVFHGRVDGVAELLQDVRRRVTVAPNEYTCNGTDVNVRPWHDPSYGPGDQRSAIAALCGRGELLANGNVTQENLPVYTRAERVAPGMQRVDQALTNHVIGLACSSFRVDWTYGPRVGEVRDPDGNIVVAPGPTDGFSDNVPLNGMLINSDPLNEPAFREHPWFGLQEADRGVYFYGSDQRPWWYWPPTVDPANIEGITHPTSVNTMDFEDGDELPNTPVVVYEAIFGYNRGLPLNDEGNPDLVIYSTSDPDCTRVGYTPWPTAIRITLTLHDQQQRLGEGREVQFVVSTSRRQ